jgi:hypothetical protein
LFTEKNITVSRAEYQVQGGKSDPGKYDSVSRTWWHMTIVLVTQEVEVGGSWPKAAWAKP